MVEVDIYIVVFSVHGDLVTVKHILVPCIVNSLTVPVNDYMTTLMDAHSDGVLVFEDSVLTLDNRVISLLSH